MKRTLVQYNLKFALADWQFSAKRKVQKISARPPPTHEWAKEWKDDDINWHFMYAQMPYKSVACPKWKYHSSNSIGSATQLHMPCESE